MHSATRLWNLLPHDTCNAPSLSQFKSKLISKPCPLVKHPSLLNLGIKRYLAILHARLLRGRSQMNGHLYEIGIKDSPLCSCGQGAPCGLFIEIVYIQLL